jgi:two-component system, OmpR family, phosphate regulon response regulator PhoB
MSDSRDVTAVKTILLCEDEKALRDLMRASLTGRDYEIVEADDGDESLRLARELRPDLVVLDMVLPGRSGLDVLAELRRDVALAETPVILCTARRVSLAGDDGERLGADRYLAKPFSPRELAEVVEELLAA